MNKSEITHETPLSFLTVGQFIDLVKCVTPQQISEKTIPEVYGVETLQQVTGYSKPSIYAKTSKNKLPHFRRDGKLLFRHVEILEWMTENRIETKAEFSRRMDQKLTERER